MKKTWIRRAYDALTALEIAAERWIARWRTKKRP